MRLYVGNLPYNVSEDDLRELFEQYGSVEDVTLITDRDTGRPRGFGFVQMPDDAATAAMEALDGTDFGGRNLHVNQARDREKRRDRGGWQ
jgi:RNA recognition motif-containing protein